MAGVSALIQDGQIVNQTTPEAKKAAEQTKEAQNSASAQKDQFLQLLVAQMKYQDPMEPTSNTEYISQYATFSSLEQMQNMASSMAMSRASDMVGKSVIIHHTDVASGETKEIEGIVDYVTYENNKAKVSVNGESFDADEVYSVVSDSYTKSAEVAKQFQEKIDALPALYDVNASNADMIRNLGTTYDSLDSTTKSLIPGEYVTSLLQYVNRITEITGKLDSGTSDGGSNTAGEENTTADGTASASGTEAADETAGTSGTGTANETAGTAGTAAANETAADETAGSTEGSDGTDGTAAAQALTPAGNSGQEDSETAADAQSDIADKL